MHIWCFWRFIIFHHSLYLSSTNHKRWIICLYKGRLWKRLSCLSELWTLKVLVSLALLLKFYQAFDRCYSFQSSKFCMFMVERIPQKNICHFKIIPCRRFLLLFKVWCFSTVWTWYGWRRTSLNAWTERRDFMLIFILGVR